MKTLKIEYSKTVQKKLQILKKRLSTEFGEEYATREMRHITDTLRNMSEFSAPGKPIKTRFGVETNYRFLVIAPNIFILSILDDNLLIEQMFNEKEDFIFKMFKIPMRSKASKKFWKE